MKILIVGFGNMGCRHAQSLINSNDSHEYFVLEPSKETFLRNVQRIGSSPEQFVLIENLVNIPKNLDFAIIATTSTPRFDLVKILISKGIKSFLLEKIVFQSENQFNVIIDLLEKNKCNCYCNFVNRYYPNYIEIRKSLNKEKPIKMLVNGSDIRLGSNSLHYIDLFEYLTGCNAVIEDEQIFENEIGSKKKDGYKELLGQIVLSTKRDDLFIISADLNRAYTTEIIITQDSQCHILNEQTKKHISFTTDTGLLIKDFEIINTSNLTSLICNDILASKSLLPTVQESKSCHVQLFKIANKIFVLEESEICPLT